LLAYHYTEAGLAGPAIANWQIAGQKATRSAGNTEAIQHFQKALGLLASQPENNERNAIELKVLTNLGPLMMMMKGGSSTEVAEIYERAEELAGQMESSQELVPAIFGRWVFHMWGGRFDRANEVAHELFEVASATGDEALLLQAHHAVWPTRMLRGDFEVSNEHVDKGLAIYDYEKHKHHAFLYLGHDPAVCGHSLKAGIAWALGFPDLAHGHAAQALQHARRMGHASTLAYGLFNVCLYHAARGDERATRPTADELWRLSNERQLVYTGAGAQVFGGWAMVKQGQTDAGLDQMRQGIATWDRLGQHMFRQAVYCLYAEALVTAGEYGLAMENLNQGLALGDQTGERWWESRAYLLHARVVLEQGDPEAAEAILYKSIKVARQQKAKSLELQATINLSRLWADQGRRDDAYGLLSPIYEWFTEGFDTADLKETRALLDGLR
jgi:predicted ATPase